MGVTVREISKRTGIPIDTLRYYDSQGLVSPKRGSNKYRLYDERDLILLQYVATMKYAQFSLSEIKGVFRSVGGEMDEECARRTVELLRGKREELASKIAIFKEIIAEFDEMLSVLEGSGGYGEKEKFMDNRIQEIFRDIGKQALE